MVLGGFTWVWGLNHIFDIPPQGGLFWSRLSIYTSLNRSPLLPSTTRLIQKKAYIQGREVEHVGKAQRAGIWTGNFPSFITVTDVHFEFYISSFSWDRREEVNGTGMCLQM